MGWGGVRWGGVNPLRVYFHLGYKVLDIDLYIYIYIPKNWYQGVGTKESLPRTWYQALLPSYQQQGEATVSMSSNMELFGDPTLFPGPALFSGPALFLGSTLLPAPPYSQAPAYSYCLLPIRCLWIAYALRLIAY